MDNGPEMTAHALRDWCELSNTGPRYRVRLALTEPVRESFTPASGASCSRSRSSPCLAEARVVVGDWQQDCSWRRLRSALRAPRSG